MISIAQVVFTFITTLVLCLFLRPFFFSLRLVAMSGDNNIHQGSVPLVGGTAILISVWMSLRIFQSSDFFFLTLSSGLLPIYLVSLLDDRYSVHPLLRLAVQSGALLLLMTNFGFNIDNISWPGLAIELGAMSSLFTILVGLFLINAFNMIDGIDGLCASVSMIGFICLGIILSGNISIFCYSITCALAGFLMLNFPYSNSFRKILETRYGKFRVFLGDSGSASVGLVFFALLCVSLEQETVITEKFNYWQAWYFIALPVLDALNTILIRMKNGRIPIYGALDHYHHALIKAGFSEGSALMLSIFISIIFAIIGYISMFNDVSTLSNLGFFLASFIIFSYFKHRLFSRSP